jgi:uncharacterized low-complexity protein
MRDTKLGKLAATVAVVGALGLGVAAAGSAVAAESGSAIVTRVVQIGQTVVAEPAVELAAEGDYQWS